MSNRTDDALAVDSVTGRMHGLRGNRREHRQVWEPKGVPVIPHGTGLKLR